MTKTKVATGFMTLKIELVPTGILRTISVPESLTLENLHCAIQAIMGWEDMHLWHFTDGTRDSVIYELPSRDDHPFFGRCLTMDASKMTLKKVFPKRGSKMIYEYDFGDSWNHKITRMADPKVAEIACLKTEGPDGIDDFGGQWHLAMSLGALREDPMGEAADFPVLGQSTPLSGLD